MLDYGMSVVWVGVLMVLVPAFALSAYLARRKKSMWLVFLIGAVGWIVALVRVPILQGLADAFLRSWIRSAGALAAPYIATAVDSLFAGLFEEGIRYGLVKKIQRTRADLGHVLSFGLGWGFGEAALIYALPIVSAVYLQGASIPFSSLLLGALERNITMVIHVGLTFVIFRAVTDVKFLFVAIGTHFAVNFVGVSLFLLTGNVWATYLVALVVALILVGYAHKLTEIQMNAQRHETLKPVERALPTSLTVGGKCVCIRPSSFFGQHCQLTNRMETVPMG